LVGRIPLTAHGIGLPIGTDVPINFDYLDKVAAAVERLQAPAYSEHPAKLGASSKVQELLSVLAQCRFVEPSQLNETPIASAIAGWVIPLSRSNII
jgi:uncharacterized protein (UPF0276 family)